ncbi:MAG: hypothetical protein NC307_03855 [Roseburia sp.]|nr:hypothetical protein [Roseburia sp.]
MQTILTYAGLTVLFLSCCIYDAFLSGAQPITSVFNCENNRELQEIAVTGLKLYFTSSPFMGLNIILSTYFTSTEKALPAQTISLSRGLFVILPMAFFLSSAFQMMGVWLSVPTTEILVSLMGILFYRKIKKTFSF